jgi:L-amino acid N-acyltransferase YncA
MIRIASWNDLPEIIGIYNEAVEQRFATADLRPVTIDQRVNWFRDHDPSIFPIYAFEAEHSVRGWCSLSAYRPGREALLGTAEISYYVRHDSQRQGIGSALVQHAASEAPDLGKRILFGILLEGNEPSIRLMRKCGFELWGRLPDVAEFDGELVSHLYYGRKVSEWRSRVDPRSVNNDQAGIEPASKE